MTWRHRPDKDNESRAEEAEKHKQEQLQKGLKEGKGQWKEELASEGERSVRTQGEEQVCHRIGIERFMEVTREWKAPGCKHLLTIFSQTCRSPPTRTPPTRRRCRNRRKVKWQRSTGRNDLLRVVVKIGTAGKGVVLRIYRAALKIEVCRR